MVEQVIEQRRNIVDFGFDGLKYSELVNENVFHLVLTSASGCGHKSLRDHFFELLNRLKDISKRDYEYLAVYTNEGNGVIHVLIKDCFLPREWFTHHWGKIHGSYIVRKDIVDYNGLKRNKSAMAKYLGGQREIIDFDVSEDFAPVYYKRLNPAKGQCTLFNYKVKSRKRSA